MTTLFGATELAVDALAGHRLERLEIYNWGTFDQRVWALNLGAQNTLLTGDIGSGKSTIVDAITTLLLPAHRISYNKAAGAETKERSLGSYVLGYHKSERNEETGTSRPVGLRDRHSFSVILGVFVNCGYQSGYESGYQSRVTLAQVFWFASNAHQPNRLFVVAEGALAIATDFAGFGDNIATLKQRLRTSGARTHDHFPQYGTDFRRQLGIDSEQAMELFHQTVSMKSVGNLNDFVRSHMLEPFDADAWTKRLVDHFEDLTKAHDAVRTAREQLAELEPLLADCDSLDRVAAEISSLKNQRDALRFYCAERKATLLTDQIAGLVADIDAHQEKLTAIKSQLGQLRIRKEELTLQRAGLGGNRLTDLERQIIDAGTERERRQSRATRYHELLAAAGLSPVDDTEQFARRRVEVRERAATLDAEQAGLQNRLSELAVRLNTVDAEAKELNAELISLRNRRSNIPKASLDLRQRLCAEIAASSEELPFAGELIQVRSDSADWEGAAERVLHGFALSMLVSSGRYTAVSDWINTHHLGARLVYYRVPDQLSRMGSDPVITDRSLYTKLEIKDSPFSGWLDRELTHRAGYECVEEMDEFRRAARAVTRAGQIKGARERHEKDDLRRIDDRRYYVLGWNNQAKINTLLAQAGSIHQQQSDLHSEREKIHTALERTSKLKDTFAKLTEFASYTDLDWQSIVNHIASLAEEKRLLEQGCDELKRVSAQLDALARDIAAAEAEQESVTGAISRLERDWENAESSLADARQTLNAPECGPARELFPLLDAHVDPRPLPTPADCDRAERDLAAELSTLVDKRTERHNRVATRVVSRMSDFRQRYPLQTAEFDDSLQSASEYRTLRDRLVNDDLPRFESEFKTYLNTNTLRDIAGFSAELNKQLDLIKRRIDTINDSLVGIDYNPERYIRLETAPTVNVEIREFRTALRECTTGALGGSGTDQDLEQRFLQVKRIIERFKGRAGQTDEDRRWTRRVTDVRNWYMFSASERWRADDTEHEHYTDSGGKSGGQKEKLAYTILAASLAYQFKLDHRGKSKTFRFVVIDEAFGRGSDESTRFALDLFHKLGLQLLIVTPLQKIHVIEPHVAAVGFVDNPSGSYSRLQSLTIEEYRQQRHTWSMQQASSEQ